MSAAKAGRLAHPEDARLVAALTMLRDNLKLVVDELLAGELDQADRDQFARTFRTLADELSRVVEAPGHARVAPPATSDGRPVR